MVLSISSKYKRGMALSYTTAPSVGSLKSLHIQRECTRQHVQHQIGIFHKTVNLSKRGLDADVCFRFFL